MPAIATHQHGSSSRQAARARFLVGQDVELRARESQYVDELTKLRDANEGIAAFLERRDPHWSNA
ncbi:MAG: hypothetical protein K8I27_10640 [Planctomycetes bacterium]|nr:hypothetical protein [Planctomycetota bacterium]